jgi:hypothetical protein
MVKYGGNNGEVYGEILGSRLLWALGFGADRMYAVNVICDGCPKLFAGIERPDGSQRFDPAVIERPMSAAHWSGDGKEGWSWKELDEAAPKVRAAKAHRDALKLLAVFLQHTDSKPEQQRVVCLGARSSTRSCRQPFLMISDLGLTFGRSHRWNDNDVAGVNLEDWKQMPVWKTEGACVGNLPSSFTGTLEDPLISEAGRRFLANLLIQLSDAQIRDLFTAARIHLRLRSPGRVDSGFATVDDWTAAFKQKRNQIVQRRCA